MRSKANTIGILTSGGDAPGMNAAIRAVARKALSLGMKVYGIRRGYNGLINDDVYEMTIRSVSNIIQIGGTCLYTARSAEFKTEEGMNKALATCKKYGIEGLVVIGGDGSYRGARDLSLKGIPCIGIPGTIDNDIASTDMTIGFDTAMNTAMEVIDKIRDTSQSHNRCSVVEVMGRKCGDIALRTGIAVGATAILMPEIPFDFETHVINRIKRGMALGKYHFIIVVAEGVSKSEYGSVNDIAKRIEESTGIVSRATTLGYIQRGGSPTLYDRLLASNMGNYAAELLEKGIGNRVVCIRDNKIIDMDIYDALEMKNCVSEQLYDIAHEISL